MRRFSKMMRRFIPWVILLMSPSMSMANMHTPAQDITYDTSVFPSPSATTVQEAIDYLASHSTATGINWGNIDGLLSNQTDLQNALNAKQNAITLANLTVGSGLSITNGTGALVGTNSTISIASGFYLPTTSDESNWNAKQNAITTGTTSQYIRGDLSLGTSPTNLNQFTNGPGYITGVTWGQITGTLSSQTDLQNALNAKQTTGSYITGLTGDISASGPGSVASTLATVNSNIGTFQGITVNGKGLVTGATNQGYITGNQSITVTGAVTGSGATSIATTLANLIVQSANVNWPSINGSGVLNSSGINWTSFPASGIMKFNGSSAPIAAVNVSDISYQPLATNLTSIGALANSSGCLNNNGTGTFSYISCSGGSGTVTSVGLSSPNTTLTIGSTPVTTSGTITADLNWNDINAIAQMGTGGINWASINSIAKMNMGGINWADGINLNTTLNWANVNLVTNSHTITSSSANAFSVGQTGTANPVFNVSDTTASSVAGVAVTGAVTGGTVSIQATDTGANTNMNVGAKGSGNLLLISGNGGTVQIDVNGTHIFQVSNQQFLLQPNAHSAATSSTFSFIGSTDGVLTASTEAPIVQWNMGQTRTHNTGTLATQRNFLLQPPTDAFSAASTITDDATLGISGAPNAGTNATITNSHGLLISAGAITGTVTNGFGLTVNAPTGASNNYAAQFNGLVNFNALNGINWIDIHNIASTNINWNNINGLGPINGGGINWANMTPTNQSVNWGSGNQISTQFTADNPSMTVPNQNYSTMTLQTTPNPGDVENDGNNLYFTPFGTSRGGIPAMQMMALSSPYTLSSSSAQKIFNIGSSSGGSVTLNSSTTYYFEMMLQVSGLSGTSGTASLTFATTGTIGSIAYQAITTRLAANGTAIASNQTGSNQAAATVICAASTTTSAQIYVTGIVRMTSTGTFTPELSESQTATPIIATNSYFKIYSIGSSSATTVGNIV